MFREVTVNLGKVLVVLVITIPLLWISYELFVRTTVIGKLLNGRIYPHGLPLSEAMGISEDQTGVNTKLKQ